MLLKFIIPIMMLALVIGCQFDEPLAPVARFKVTGSGCVAPCKVSFTDLSENKGVYAWVYSWKFKDSTAIFSVDQSPVFNFNKAGKYKVSMTISNPKYGMHTFEDTLTILAPKPKPKAAFTLKGGNCEAPCKITFSNASTNSEKYVWEFGDKTTSSESEPEHLYATAGSFTIKLKATNSVGADSTTQVVVIKEKEEPKPQADFSFKEDFSKKDTTIVIFSNLSQNATAYKWDFGDGSSSLEKDPPKHEYPHTKEEATYNVKLTASGKKEPSEKTLPITIKKKQ